MVVLSEGAGNRLGSGEGGTGKEVSFHFFRTDVGNEAIQSGLYKQEGAARVQSDNIFAHPVEQTHHPVITLALTILVEELLLGSDEVGLLP